MPLSSRRARPVRPRETPCPTHIDPETAAIVAEVARVFGDVELVEVRWLSGPQPKLTEGPATEAAGQDAP